MTPSNEPTKATDAQSSPLFHKCRRCGSAPIYHAHHRGVGGPMFFTVHCDCADPRYLSLDDAIADWNRVQSPACVAADTRTQLPGVTMGGEVSIEVVRAAMAEAFGVKAMSEPGWSPQRAMHKALACRLAGAAVAEVREVSEEDVERALTAYCGPMDSIGNILNKSVPVGAAEEMMRAALVAYERGRKSGDGWIKCSERMPEPMQRVVALCIGCRDRTQTAQYLSDWSPDYPWALGWINLKESDVTHWRPLPPAPARREGEES